MSSDQGRIHRPSISGVISRFISALAKGEQPVIYGDGEQTRDFVYVKDVVRANILASRNSSGVFNIAGGRRTNLNQIASLIGKILVCNVRPEHRDPRAGDIRDSLGISQGLERLATSRRPAWRMDSPRR